ncbi:PREDICTED: uncharacterized protein LOC106745216 [Dinoponera quadriceps]|uniref:Uncharacterized protein LOC106745216 n=1 Tax=Dinoponera quadriceps TaxID=609295 RepID=A0A6P3XCH8_DINQU|nr:PREDICTED: uncharacterized protein LOC106745216 [Dinoponera quadriceps]
MKHGIVQLRQPLYNSDLAPCDFWLFLKLKNPLKGRRFDDVEEIKRNATKQLLLIPTKSDTFRTMYLRGGKKTRVCSEYVTALLTKLCVCLAFRENVNSADKQSSVDTQARDQWNNINR